MIRSQFVLGEKSGSNCKVGPSKERPWDGQNLRWFWNVSFAGFLKVFWKKESQTAGRNVIKSPFPWVRKFGKGEAKCEDAGKGNKCGRGREGTQRGTGSQRPWRGKEKKAGITKEAPNESKHGLRAKCSRMTRSLSLCPWALSFSSLSLCPPQVPPKPGWVTESCGKHKQIQILGLRETKPQCFLQATLEVS